MPAVTKVIANSRKNSLVSETLHLPEQDYDLEPLARQVPPRDEAEKRQHAGVSSRGRTGSAGGLALNRPSCIQNRRSA